MLEIFTKLADLISFDLLGLDPSKHFSQSVHFFIEDTTKIFALLTVLMFIVGYLRTWMSPEKVRDWLDGKPKIFAYFLAVTLGALTPFCSCSSIPLFIAFLSSGIPLGVTMAFLITSPMVNEVAAVLFGEAIGWDFTVYYVLTGTLIGGFGGFLIDILKLEKWVEPFVYEAAFTETKMDGPKLSAQKRVKMSWDETKDILNRVWIYVLVGVGVGAGLHGFLPDEWFIEYAGSDNLLAVPTAVIMAIPLYANVTGTIPVAEVLISKGLPIGTTLAFIMSTVAISLPELVILRKVLKPKMIAFFVFYLMASFIVIGYGFNLLY